VAVRLDAIAEPLTGRVGEIAPTVEEGSRGFVVKIDLPGRAEIRSGMFGRAEFPLGERDALVVPRGAVRAEGQVQTVMVVDNSGAARSRMIRSGETRGEMVEIVAGVEAGERVGVSR
jgi:multidrug efflux pump subunit AcrA (membrane-fusion protein)